MQGNTTADRYFMLYTINYSSNVTTQREGDLFVVRLIWQSLNLKAIINASNKVVFWSEINFGKNACHRLRLGWPLD